MVLHFHRRVYRSMHKMRRRERDCSDLSEGIALGDARVTQSNLNTTNTKLSLRVRFV